jgi:hypothetical protein
MQTQEPPLGSLFPSIYPYLFGTALINPRTRGTRYRPYLHIKPWLYFASKSSCRLFSRL